MCQTESRRTVTRTQARIQRWVVGSLLIPLSVLSSGCISVRQELPRNCRLNWKQCVERIDLAVKVTRKQWRGSGKALLGADEAGWTDLRVVGSDSRSDGKSTVTTYHAVPCRHSYQEIERVDFLWSASGLFFCGLVSPLCLSQCRVVLRGGETYRYYDNRVFGKWCVFPIWLLNPAYPVRKAKERAVGFEYMRRHSVAP